MSVQTQIDRISGAVSAALAALTEKGVTVPDGTKVDGLATLIAAIESGGGSDNVDLSGFPNISKVKTGSFTLTSNARKYEVSHGLGELPKIFVCLVNGSSKINKAFACAVASQLPGGKYYHSLSRYYGTSYGVNSSEESRPESTALSSHKIYLITEEVVGMGASTIQYFSFMANTEYRWFAMA